jgi:hypothetical protein
MKRLALLLLLGAGCGDDEVVPKRLQANLALELRDGATLTFELRPDDTLHVQLRTRGGGYGLLAPDAVLEGEGRIERFPETEGVLYTARFDGPPQGGPCGAEPVSLAFSLHQQQPEVVTVATVIGGIACYCGGGVWHGTPARILRLDGAIAPQAIDD